MIDCNIKFKNRIDAAMLLSAKLPIELMKLEKWEVIAVSANSIPIALYISQLINTNCDFLYTSKIYAKYNKECEIAIITENEEVVVHKELIEAFDIKLDIVYKKAYKKYQEEIVPYLKKYKNNIQLNNTKGKNILLVDEGLNTGITMMACIKDIVKQGANSISIAVPILPHVTIVDIENIADDLYYVNAPMHFTQIDKYYNNYQSLKFNEVNKILKREIDE